MSHDPDVQLRPDSPCLHCGGDLLFTVRVPTRFELADGQSVAAYRTATLCPHCDRNDPAPAVQGVLAFFAVHERITNETLQQAAPMIREWIDHVTANPPVYTDEERDEDIRRWESGEM